MKKLKGTYGVIFWCSAKGEKVEEQKVFSTAHQLLGGGLHTGVLIACLFALSAMGLFALFILRLAQTFNQSGDKWSYLSDFGDWLKMSTNW